MSLYGSDFVYPRYGMMKEVIGKESAYLHKLWEARMAKEAQQGQEHASPGSSPGSALPKVHDKLEKSSSTASLGVAAGSSRGSHGQRSKEAKKSGRSYSSPDFRPGRLPVTSGFGPAVGYTGCRAYGKRSVTQGGMLGTSSIRWLAPDPQPHDCLRQL
mmetsp:Transcript_158583/g.280051  ORF Transcript_158583/g.280051 Transcript_158583/m.280051 type:complete len:158 (-) Transcript_158583:29-502(-)